jgi:hypothetical protein
MGQGLSLYSRIYEHFKPFQALNGALNGALKPAETSLKPDETRLE